MRAAPFSLGDPVYIDERLAVRSAEKRTTFQSDAELPAELRTDSLVTAGGPRRTTDGAASCECTVNFTRSQISSFPRQSKEMQYRLKACPNLECMSQIAHVPFARLACSTLSVTKTSFTIPVIQRVATGVCAPRANGLTRAGIISNGRLRTGGDKGGSLTV
eukprot:Polyplicarium_translucidae@DN3282_c0_g2_i7.p2